MSGSSTVLVRVSGQDRPGITAGLLATAARHRADILDMEQIVVRDRLTLDVLMQIPDGSDLLKDVLYYGWKQGISIDFEIVDSDVPATPGPRFAVTIIGPDLTAEALTGVAEAIATGAGNIDRIVQLSRQPVISYELIVSSGDIDAIRAGLGAVAVSQQIDIAIQREGLGRRAKRLVVLDVDSTLIQGEVIDRLAAAAGAGAAVQHITERAMAGEIDFADALLERVAALAGLDERMLAEVAAGVKLTPGARTFVRTLKRLGFVVAAVSGGFTFMLDRLQRELGLDHVAGNTLEVAEGRLTGRLVGDVIDRSAKADVLARIAATENIPLEQTVAVGDGANDIDMLAAAGLGIAFNARPAVREAADTWLSVPYLDAVLFVLGIRRDEIEEADRERPVNSS